MSRPMSVLPERSLHGDGNGLDLPGVTQQPLSTSGHGAHEMGTVTEKKHSLNFPFTNSI